MTTAQDILIIALERLGQSGSLNRFCTVFESEWIFTFAELQNVVGSVPLWSGLHLPAVLKLEIEAVLRERSPTREKSPLNLHNFAASRGEKSPPRPEILYEESNKPSNIVNAEPGETGPFIESDRKMKNRLLPVEGDDDHQERTKVVVRVPATSANLGPGFDAIGIAIDMWSEFTVERSEKFEIVCEGEGSLDMPLDESNLVCFGVAAAFKHAGKPLPTLKYHLNTRIPFARGLGSSSAAIVGGLVAGLVLAGHQLKTLGAAELLNLAADIEGHPDNAAPALYGGIQLGIHTGKLWRTERVNLPAGLQCVCFIPETIGKKSTARGVLKPPVSREDAVFDIGRVAWLINALSSNNGVDDALQQTQRAATVYPHLEPIVKAAILAGASAAYLSGAGPSVMALTSGASGDIFTQRYKERVDRAVAEAMLAAAKLHNVPGEVFITAPVEKGAHVVSAEPAFTRDLVKFRSEM